jgi:hypothetical protein
MSGVPGAEGAAAEAGQSQVEILSAKAAVRERDGYRCVECGMTNADHSDEFGSVLQVHRLVPGSLYHPDGCVTLCIPCHGPKPKRPRGILPGRNRLQVELAERERRAFLLFAASKGKSVPEAFAHLIDSQLARWLKLADEEIAAESKAPKPKGG